MGRTNSVNCNDCRRPMTFHSEVKDVAQFYHCHNCYDKWAIAYLNRHGGIYIIKHKNWSSVTNTKFALEIAKTLGKAIGGK